MGKVYNDLLRQLETEYKEEAKDCIKVYNKLKELNNGSVWESDSTDVKCCRLYIVWNKWGNINVYQLENAGVGNF